MRKLLIELKFSDGELVCSLSEEDWKEHVIPLMESVAKTAKGIVKFNNKEVLKLSVYDANYKRNKKNAAK